MANGALARLGKSATLYQQSSMKWKKLLFFTWVLIFHSFANDLCPSREEHFFDLFSGLTHSICFAVSIPIFYFKPTGRMIGLSLFISDLLYDVHVGIKGVNLK